MINMSKSYKVLIIIKNILGYEMSGISSNMGNISEHLLQRRPKLVCVSVRRGRCAGGQQTL